MEIHQLAMRKLIQDTTINRLEGRVIILENEKYSIRENMTAELDTERATAAELRVKLQAEEGISGTYKEELQDMKKKNRSLRWQRNGAVVLGLVVIVLSL